MSEERSLLVLENYIGGKFVSCRSYIDSYDPSTGEVYCKVPDSGKEEVDAAVAAAKEAFPEWSANLEEFAQAESKDQGKTITAARTVDIPGQRYNFRFFSTSMLHHTTDCSPMDHMGCLNYTIRCPVGTGLISNTVVAKPSEMTSVTAWMLCKLMQQAGVPPGVVNIVFGSGPRAGDALVSHPEVPLVSFTGSTATAQRITERSAPYCKKLSLELGDLDQCIETTVRSSFLNQVKTKCEVCLCTSRIYVERSIYSEFLERFVAAAKKWKTGVPLTPANVTKHLLFKFLIYIALAKSEGGIIHCGEGSTSWTSRSATSLDTSCRRRSSQAYLTAPVSCRRRSLVPSPVSAPLILRMKLLPGAMVYVTVCQPQCGPRMWEVHRVAQRLQAGLVWTNCWLVRDLNLPFGGMKNSGGEGRRKRFLSLLHREIICVCVRYSHQNLTVQFVN
uniref:Aldehyde dehydrogenase 8 family, member A1 n=1 Tax=Maylandia zebra TaxID=106582 RepID=A0A3P9DCT2_9CICH